MGDRPANLKAGFAALTGADHTRLAAESAYYMTEPVDYTDQDWFVNAVIAVETALPPEDLLAALKSIEKAAGRNYNTVRFGPRALDLDILLYEDRVIDAPGLTVPHPRMHLRRFALRPMCDIDPDRAHPVLGKTMAALLSELDAAGQELARL